MVQNLEIYVDLDEVLVDFTTPAAFAHGAVVSSNWPIPYSFGMDDETFWGPINKIGEEFWLSIDTFDWAEDVLQLVQPYEWDILTQPGKHVSSYTGKIKWLYEYFDGDISHCLVTRKPKCKFARPNTLLIDDSEKNVKEFVECGGNAILFPSRLNKLHPLFNDPIPYLKDQLESYNGHGF